MNNFDDRMKADMNKLSELLEEGVKIQEITKIHRIGKYNPDNKGKHRQIKVVFKDNITRDKVLRNASNLKQADDKYKHCYIRKDLRPDTGLKIFSFQKVLFIDIITSKDWLLLL